jgi:hypothetical protein
VLSLHPTGGNYVSIHQAIKRLELDASHFTGRGHLKGKQHDWTPTISFEEILVENSTYNNRSKLKSRLIKAGLLKNACYECGIAEWRGKALSLVLDHINGQNDDNRLGNLRLLCPNCNSQTETFAGRNKGRYRLAKAPSGKVKELVLRWPSRWGLAVGPVW